MKISGKKGVISMKLMCPKCGSRFKMEQAVRELEQAETHDIAAKLGQHWRLVFEYSECFRQSEYGDVSLESRLRIFRSVARLFDTGIFSYRGRSYRTSWHEVTTAMTEICNMAKWGFRNHNYLLTMLTKGADRLSAEGLTAREEREREHARAAHSSQGTALEKMDFKKLATDLRG